MRVNVKSSPSTRSLEVSQSSTDSIFESPYSEYSDCEYCEERRRRRQNGQTYRASHNPITPSSAYFSCCSDMARLESAPLLGSPAPAPVYKSITSQSDSLGPGELSSNEILNNYGKLLEKPTKPENIKQSSLVTIFSVWNTIMGSSLLTMAWGVERAGLPAALILFAVMAAICLYTAYVLLTVNRYHGSEMCEVPALCRTLLGRPAEVIAHIFSFIVLLGANVVYWILITNFLYYTINYFRDLNENNSTDYNSNTTLLCPKHNGINGSLLIPEISETNNSSPWWGLHTTVPLYVALIVFPLLNFRNVTFFTKFNSLVVLALQAAIKSTSGHNSSPWWGLHTTVPLYVALIVFPLLNFRNVTFFTKFNSLGTLSVLYLMIFVVTKAAMWGINFPTAFEPHAGTNAAVLSGMLALSFYIHNIIITIMSNNAKQENNGRDLTIAFILVTVTYTMVGAVFYICFPLAKSCIEDNLLNNFEMHDIMSAVARVLLLFQVVTVYPLVAFMLRNEAILLLPCRDTMYLTITINVAIVAVCILVACFCPNIGVIIRYTGAISGLVHIFLLPSLLHLRSLQVRNRLSWWRVAFYSTLVLLGATNLIMQFFITE